jgi:hypothetical protein
MGGEREREGERRWRGGEQGERVAAGEGSED